jgi:aspartate racemase
MVLATNTMNKLTAQMMEGLSIPLLHIADATAHQVRAAGLERVGLLGTRFTMEQDFYKGRLVDNFGLQVELPDAAGRELVHRVIYEELVLGQIRADSRAGYAKVIAGLVERGAQGIILGCTEIGLLVGPSESPVPLFDTTLIHARAAVDFALG